MSGQRGSVDARRGAPGASWLSGSALLAAVLLLHVLGWGLLWFYSGSYPTLAGLGALAYTFGLRHAFDADHIAAIDNTTRKLVQDGKRPLDVGFFFSLGHATIVLALTAALTLSSGVVNSRLPELRAVGGLLGAGVAGTFLWVIAILNLIVLLDMGRGFLGIRSGAYDERRLEQRLLDRGLLSRLLLGRLASRISRSWDMYPLGLLFGLGFDTATEVGLLALAAGATTPTVPFPAVMSLALLFAAGMSLMDTADGAFMSRAYGWAASNPLRRTFYNLVVTALSVIVALLIGTIELLQAATRALELHGGFWRFVASLDLGHVGYAITGLFIVTWAAAALIWRTARFEQRWLSAAE